MTVLVPLRTYGPNLREHWSARSRRVRAERIAVTALVRAGGPLPPLPVRVTFTRISPGELDDDNLRGALKGPRDAIAALYGVDDRRGTGIEWAYAQERGPRGQHHVRVHIERVRHVALETP